MRPFLFSPQRRVYLRRYSGAPPEASLALEVSADIGRLRRPGVFAMAWRGECRALPAETRGDRAPMVPFPLLTPQALLWTRLPPVARLNARGPQGRLVLQEYTLDGSGAFRSGTPPPCTVWPRTVMRGGLRKLTSGPDSVPKSARRTEPSPRNSRFAAHLRCVSAKEGKGSQEGTGNHTWCPVPFCPPPWARRLRRRRRPLPTPCHGEHPSSREGLSRLRRQATGTAENFAPACGKAEKTFTDASKEARGIRPPSPDCRQRQAMPVPG